MEIAHQSLDRRASDQNAPPPSSTASQRKALAEQKKEQRAKAKQAKHQALLDAVAAASAAIKPPPEIGQWGVVRTRCWKAIFTRLEHQLSLRRKSQKRLSALVESLNKLPSISDAECASLLGKLDGVEQ